MKQIFLFLLLLSGLSRPALYGQTACDTLLCKDGRRIHAQILGSKSGGILYTPCGENTGRQLFIEKEKVQTILFQNKPEKIIRATESGKIVLFNRATSKDYSDKTRVVIWAGFSLVDGVRYATEGEKFSAFQFGGQVNLKSSPIQLGLILRPLFYTITNLAAFEKQGVNGEATFILKNQGVGRLSGKPQKGYWGCDFQIGRSAYSYVTGLSGAFKQNLRKTTWIALLPRIGYQLCWDACCLDLAFPIGFKSVNNHFPNSYSPFKYRETSLVFQPALLLGVKI
jgi:hypothetical protein